MQPTAIIIDDSLISRSVMRRALCKAGFTVVAEQPDGERAVELYETHRPSVIVLDIVLPGKNGVAVASQLLKKHPQANVVMCSSMVARDQILACREAGVADFILKPFSIDGVLETLQAVANRVT